MKEKKVSVIMGIYNCADTLSDALDCILKQTYQNWEVILCDDGSTDDTCIIAMDYVQRFPEKFVLIKNKTNRGLNYTLNRCLKKASGQYIARMDGDDLCSPLRFEKEVYVLDHNHSFAIVSTDMEFFDENGVWGRTRATKFPNKYNFLSSTPFCHAACMVRREAFLDVDGYSVDEKLLRVEDYHLWVKMYAVGYKGVNIQEALYQMRDDRNAIARKKFKYRINEVHVKAIAIKELHLPFWGYLYCMKPIILGIIPTHLYKLLHRIKK